MFSPLPLLSLITTYPFEVATRPDSSVIWVSATVHTGWPRPGTGVPSPGTTGVGEGAYANAGAAPRKNASTPMNDTTTARRIGQVSQSRSSCGGPSPLPGRRDGRHRVRRQLGRQRLVHSRVHHGALRGVLARAHLAPGVHPRHQVTTLVRHPRPELHRRPGKPSLHLGPELGEPGAGAGRDEHRVGPQPLEAQQRLLLCRVDRNASTSWCGRCRTNPTVSDSVYTRPSAVWARRVVVSRVANSASSTRTPAPVNRLSRLDLPALV